MVQVQSSGEYPCAVCRTGVGNHSIYCIGCKLWVHKNCNGLQRLTPNSDYRCARCVGNARPIDGRQQNEVQVGPDKLEVVASFCYLDDMLSAGGGCEIAVTTRVKTARKKFRELQPVLTSVLAWGAPCSMPVKVGHLPRQKIVSEYDQEIPQSQTADNPVAPQGRAAQPSQDTRKTN